MRGYNRLRVKSKAGAAHTEQKGRCERRRGPGWEPGVLGSSSSCTPYSPGQVPRPIPQFLHLRTEYGSKMGTILAQGLSHRGQSADMSEYGPFFPYVWTQSLQYEAVVWWAQSRTAWVQKLALHGATAVLGDEGEGPNPASLSLGVHLFFNKI